MASESNAPTTKDLLAKARRRGQAQALKSNGRCASTKASALSCISDGLEPRLRAVSAAPRPQIPAEIVLTDKQVSSMELAEVVQSIESKEAAIQWQTKRYEELKQDHAAKMRKAERGCKAPCRDQPWLVQTGEAAAKANYAGAVLHQEELNLKCLLAREQELKPGNKSRRMRKQEIEQKRKRRLDALEKQPNIHEKRRKAEKSPKEVAKEPAAPRPARVAERENTVYSAIGRMGGLAIPVKPQKIYRTTVDTPVPQQVAGCKRKSIEDSTTQSPTKHRKTVESYHTRVASTQQGERKASEKPSKTKKRALERDEDGDNKESPPKKSRGLETNSLPQPGAVVASEPCTPTKSLKRKKEAALKAQMVDTKDESDAEPRAERPAKRSKLDQKCGISRFDYSCHLSVAMQVIDCVLEGHNVKDFLGDFEMLDDFGFSQEDFALDLFTARLKKRALEKEETLIERLRNVRDLQDDDHNLSVASRLSSVLSAIRNGCENTTASYLFKQVFAYSCKSRESFNGNEQQDCTETLDKVTEALLADFHLPDPVEFQNLFQTHMISKISCRSEGCNEDIVKEESHKYLVLDISRSSSSTPVDLNQLIEQSLRSDIDESCKCGAERESKATLERLPENLILQVNRVRQSCSTKNTTPLDLTFDDITIGDTRFQLHAIVKHEGKTSSCGHYHVLVKHHNDWFKLDDNVKTPATRSELLDNRRNGESAMLLLKKTPLVDEP